jgi:16S rRNA (uracil1498-N3)-methyltransferase
MRANYKLQRLHLSMPMWAGDTLELPEAPAHYVRSVLRMEPGAALLVFNGSDGEWLARIAAVSKRAVTVTLDELTRPQTPLPDMDVLFAPLKVGRLDYLVQKLTEMGAGRIRPVITAFTQNRNAQSAKMNVWALEAAEQCGILAVPRVDAPQPLADVLTGWDSGRRLIFCDEDNATQNPLDVLTGLPRGPLAVLIGPEGGFSDAERAMLRALPFVTAIPLGPRILRADTAAVAALAVVQAALGDWR